LQPFSPVGSGLYGRVATPAEFAAKGRLLSGTVHDTTFIGVHHGRAYLKEWRMWPVVGARTQVLWTEADGLSPEVLRELEVSVKQEP